MGVVHSFIQIKRYTQRKFKIPIIIQMNKDTPQLLQNFVIFKTDNGKVNIDVYFKDDTLWLTQKLMSVLFEKDRTVITKHLKNIFSEKELDENSVCANFAHTAADGKTYSTKYYNLRAITAVGYRVNSARATQFNALFSR